MQTVAEARISSIRHQLFDVLVGFGRILMQGCKHGFCIVAELPSLLSLGLVRLVDGHVAEDGEALLNEELDGRSIGKVERRVARQILIRVDVGEVSEARHPHSVALGPVSD